uniref:Uncharacterized protein n=1 Tax=Triticum urartu TaxID=4572 RepID=A0A8R7QSN0_TRIUA
MKRWQIDGSVLRQCCAPEPTNTSIPNSYPCSAPAGRPERTRAHAHRMISDMCRQHAPGLSRSQKPHGKTADLPLNFGNRPIHTATAANIQVA